MEFIESERGNQKLNIKLKKKLWGAIILGWQLSGGLLSGGYCPAPKDFEPKFDWI